MTPPDLTLHEHARTEMRQEAESDALDEIMTSAEVAKLLRLPRTTVEDYARRGVIPSIQLGKHRRFVRSDVAATIDRLRQVQPGVG